MPNEFEGKDDHDLLIIIATKMQKVERFCDKVEKHEKDITVLQTQIKVVAGIAILVMPFLLWLVDTLIHR